MLKRSAKLIFAASSPALLIVGSLALARHPQNAAATSDRTPVIVELFTSEGCSSCPPADNLLQQLNAKQPLHDADIIPLEEHVDYWDHDGWNDPYSSPQWTERQASYGSFFRTESYTPQMVVDGKSQFVGSSVRDAGAAIENAAHSAKTDVTIASAKPLANGEGDFTVTVGKLAGSSAGDSAEVWLAITEDGLQSSVSGGENQGSTLRHVATVRSLYKIGVADSNGNASSFTADQRIKLNPQWNAANLKVVVFVQEKRNRQIIGAASLKVSS
jgi:hypothetical protein